MGEQDAMFERIRLGNGFTPAHRERIDRVFAGLESQLERLPSDGFDGLVSLKDGDPDRDHNPKQQTTLEVWAAGGHRYVTTSREPNLDDALLEVRDDMWRMIKRALDRRIDRRRRAGNDRT